MKNTYFTLLLGVVLFYCFENKSLVDNTFPLKKFEKTFVFVPKTQYQYGVDFNDQSKWAFHRNIEKNHLDSLSAVPPVQTINLDAFYIKKYEVTNEDYRRFLSDLKRTNPEVYTNMFPDQSVFRNKYPAYGEPYTESYFEHPAYDKFPVVGISYEQANQYCKWLTSKYMKLKNRKFKKVQFKLPTKAQWSYGATSGRKISVFPWTGWLLHNKKGEWRANFRIISQRHIGLSATSNYLRDRPAVVLRMGSDTYQGMTVGSFEPNELGLYDMAGNVEEFIREIGISKGGSWNDTGYYLQTFVEERYDTTNSASFERGFRIVMELIK